MMGGSIILGRYVAQPGMFRVATLTRCSTGVELFGRRKDVDAAFNRHRVCPSQQEWFGSRRTQAQMVERGGRFTSTPMPAKLSIVLDVRVQVMPVMGTEPPLLGTIPPVNPMIPKAFRLDSRMT
jgi:hypothetical protein